MITNPWIMAIINSLVVKSPLVRSRGPFCIAFNSTGSFSKKMEQVCAMISSRKITCSGLKMFGYFHPKMSGREAVRMIGIWMDMIYRMALTRLLKIFRPWRIARMILPRSSSVRTRSAARLAVSVPFFSHSDADISSFQGRAIIHSISSHGYNITIGL